MTLEEIRELFEYDEWATNRILESVSALSEQDYRKDLGSSHGGMHTTLVHICGADELWLGRWAGNPPAAMLSVEDIPSLGILRERWDKYRSGLGVFLGGLDEARLNAPHSYKDSRGNEYRQILSRLMLHKLNHASFHRGQVVAMLRQVGAVPKNTDLSAFYRETKKVPK